MYSTHLTSAQANILGKLDNLNFVGKTFYEKNNHEFKLYDKT